MILFWSRVPCHGTNLSSYSHGLFAYLKNFSFNWLDLTYEELGLSNLKAVTLHCGNQSAIHIAKNPVFHERRKDIEIDSHFTREKVLEGLLLLSYTPTQQQLADVLSPRFFHHPSKTSNQTVHAWLVDRPCQFAGGLRAQLPTQELSVPAVKLEQCHHKRRCINPA